jgi:hypothetical protein
VLGYALYASYLRDIKNYVDGGEFRPGKTKWPREFPSLGKKVKNPELFSGDSWVELFAKDDLHIVGFGLGLEEMHFWYMLTYFSRKEEKRNRDARKKASYFANSVFYHYPVDESGEPHVEAKDEQERLALVAMKGRELDLMDILGVVREPFELSGCGDEKSWTNFYSGVLGKIEIEPSSVNDHA